MTSLDAGVPGEQRNDEQADFTDFVECALDPRGAAEHVASLRVELQAARDEAAAARRTLDEAEERVEYGHQTEHFGWIPEYRGIKYARHQRTVRLLIGEPVVIDHWTHDDHRHPVEGCTVCASSPDTETRDVSRPEDHQR